MKKKKKEEAKISTERISHCKGLSVAVVDYHLSRPERLLELHDSGNKTNVYNSGNTKR